MLRSFFTLIVLLAVYGVQVSVAQAGSKEDWKYCAIVDGDRSIKACTRIIKRGNETKANQAIAHSNRGNRYVDKKQYDKALADYNTAIRLNPKDEDAWYNRGIAYDEQKMYEKAIADYTKAIELAPKYVSAYLNRGLVYRKTDRFEKAIADYSSAIRINPKYSKAYNNRGYAYELKKLYHKAIDDYSLAIQHNPIYARAIFNRGDLYEKLKRYNKARRDYERFLALPMSNSDTRKKRHDEVERRLDKILAKLEAQSPPEIVTHSTPKHNERRVALVIGNSKYPSVGNLQNPRNDAREVARALRRVGFSEVVERHDLDLHGLLKALKAFGDKAENADWALVYFAGHGIQVDGQNYLIPSDAKLVRATHVEDEAVSLGRVLSKVKYAKKMRLVILDACRDNPFRKRMIARGVKKRSIGRGLALIEPDQGTLVAFSARDGQIASDGVGKHSPFTQALLDQLRGQRVEISLFFRKVRDKVLRKTNKSQEPYVYGSLPGTELYFK